jgi:hypothetical protein
MLSARLLRELRRYWVAHRADEGLFGATKDPASRSA